MIEELLKEFFEEDFPEVSKMTFTSRNKNELLDYKEKLNGKEMGYYKIYAHLELESNIKQYKLVLEFDKVY